MNVFKGTLLRISQTNTLPGLIATANLSPSAENASAGTWRSPNNAFWDLGMGIDMRVTKEKFKLFVPPESE